MNTNFFMSGNFHVAVISILVSALIVFFIPYGASSAQKEALDDLNIEDAVEDELLLDNALPGFRIDVTVNDGIVTLDGMVDNILAKERAVKIAETVRGVRAVVDKIKVRTDPMLSDEDIEKSVKNALLSDPATDSYEIEVKVENNVVSLSGTVDSFQEKELSAKVAKSVAGIEKLDDNIKVVIDSERPDSEIEAEVRQALKWNALIDDGLIEVQVKDGKVFLTGSVGSASEKRKAELESYVAGVGIVEASGLKVSRWARDSDLRKDKYEPKSDDAVKKAIEDALLYDPRVNSFNVVPEVVNGHVTLRGTVDNLKAKKAAGGDARNVVGVRGVVNRVIVSPDADPKKNDVEKAANAAFYRDPYLKSYEIDVSFSNGVATISGVVDSYFEKARAEEVVSGVAGVIVVDNNVKVLDANGLFVYEPYVTDIYPEDYPWYSHTLVYPRKSDSEIEKDIKSQLFWSPFVDRDDVTVEVDDGKASLTGVVDSLLEYEAAEENAYEGGAVFVDNELAVAVHPK